MATENAKRDNNYVPTLMAADMSTGNDSTKVYADETTHRLLVSAVTSGVVLTNTFPYTVQIDTTSTANTVYIGSMTIGAGTAASALWQIKKIGTTIVDIKWADSNALFDNIWDNRVTLTYGL